jgi:hydroxypyruvate isomerase
LCVDLESNQIGLFISTGLEGLTNPLSVCAETVFRSLPFEQRAREIAQEGFLVEFWHRPDAEIDALEADTTVQVSTFVGSEIGSMLHPDGVETFMRGVERNLTIAKRLRCRRMILVTGEMGPQGEVIHPIHEHPAKRWISAYKTLCRVAELAEKHDVTYFLEHLNTKVDHAGYALARVEDAVRLIDEVGSPRVRLLLDMYHAQVEQGNIIQTIRDYKNLIGYVHVADAPGRHEPGTGEIDYAHVMAALQEVGYAGPIGMEAFPLDDRQALQRFRQLFGAKPQPQRGDGQTAAARADVV